MSNTMGVVSMTGFGECREKINDIQITCRVRSLNHRFLDTRIRLPRPDWIALDMAIRKQISKKFQRGSFEINLNLELPKNSPTALINTELAKSYLQAAKALSTKTSEKGDLKTSLTMDGLMRLPGVTGSHYLEDFLDAKTQKLLLSKVVDPALDALIEMRQKEGAKLKTHIKLLSKQIAEHIDAISKLEQESKDKLRTQLLERCKNTMNLISQEQASLNTGEFEKRLHEEAAFYLERKDFEEERVRFQLHMEHLDQMIHTPPNDGLGRKLEFIQQELFREINTLTNKAQSVDISRHSVEIKSLLEKLKEQLANVE